MKWSGYKAIGNGGEHDKHTPYLPKGAAATYFSPTFAWGVTTQGCQVIRSFLLKAGRTIFMRCMDLHLTIGICSVVVFLN